MIVLHQGLIVEDGPCHRGFAAPQAACTRDVLDAIPDPDPDMPWLCTGCFHSARTLLDRHHDA